MSIYIFSTNHVMCSDRAKSFAYSSVEAWMRPGQHTISSQAYRPSGCVRYSMIRKTFPPQPPEQWGQFWSDTLFPGTRPQPPQ
jgi:hypothetical protein